MMSNLVDVDYVDGAFMFKSIEAAKSLRTSYRVVTNAINQFNTPLENLFSIDKYTVACLSQLHPEILQINSAVQAQVAEIQKEFKYRVYCDLYNQGYYVLNGSKYGADFAIYSDDPLFVHATALIFALEYEEDVKKLNFIELNRISMIAKKDCILAHLAKNQDELSSEHKSIQYSSVTRCTVSWHKKDGVRKKNNK